MEEDDEVEEEGHRMFVGGLPSAFTFPRFHS